MGLGGAGGGWSKLISFTMNPNLKIKKTFLGGGGMGMGEVDGGGEESGGGARVSNIFHKESKSKIFF